MPDAPTALDHVRHLAGTIGSRGTTTDGERAGAAYAAAALEALGLTPTVEPFPAPVSGWRPFALASAAALVATALAVWGGRGGAAAGAVLLAIATASVFLEMYFRPNPLRAFVHRGESRNVHARLAPTGPVAQRLLLVAHVDTHRTPWAFTSPTRLALFKASTSAGVAAFVLGTLAFATVALLDPGAARAWLLVLVPVYAWVLGLTLQPDATPHTAGANDNASGVGVVLELADRFTRARLARTEVTVVVTGAEEVGSYGAQAYLAHHPEVRRDGTRAISVDNVAGRGAGPCWTTVEGMVFPLRPDPDLRARALALAARRPELGAYERPYTTLHTDATTFMAAGVPSISFVGLTPDGVIPDWHTVGDVVERVDAGVLARTTDFVEALVRRVDAGGV
jgi:acetylornithine deacetylase/succinyl-diaminopimelate desuccinylase-like protein